VIAGVIRRLRDRLRAALTWAPLVIAAMLVGAVDRLMNDEGVAAERIRLQVSTDRRVWRLLIDGTEVFTVLVYGSEVRGLWAYPPEAARFASLWTERSEDAEA